MATPHLKECSFRRRLRPTGSQPAAAHVAHVLACAALAASRLHAAAAEGGSAAHPPAERCTEEQRVSALRTRKKTGGGFAL